MISRPTTDQLIADCCQELLETFMPLLPDETMQVRLVMTETVLRNAAVRAAHEIAWMREETLAMEQFARDVHAAHSDSAVAGALERLADEPRDRLHLEDVVEVYGRAGEAFAEALAVAQRAGAVALTERAKALLDQRLLREREVMSTYGVAGR